MRRITILLFIHVCLLTSMAMASTRLIILADMGNEPDEEQQMVHMLMCSNEFELEGLIAVTGRWLGPHCDDPYKQNVHPELFHELINAYAQVLDNLKKHASGWQEPNYLHSIVREGQKGYGTEGLGKGKSSPGFQLIIQAVEKEDPRPIWIVINAGSNTLAQALLDYRDTHTQEETEAFVRKLRVFENGAQDNAGAWICSQFPTIHWLRSHSQTYCYGGPGWEDRSFMGPYVWEPYENTELGQNFWMLKHIKAEHGPLGKLYPLRQFSDGKLRHLEGGGTIPWMGLVNKGLFDINHQHWGGWSGRFSREKEKNHWSGCNGVKPLEQQSAPFYVYTQDADRWINPDTGKEETSANVAIWRWRRAMWNDFRCRMDWCVEPYDKANHHPVACINGDGSNTILCLKTKAGKTVLLDATGSHDPDRDDLIIHWWIYQEAGTYNGNVLIEPVDLSQKFKAKVNIPDDAQGKQIHVILEVKDQSPITSLYDYRRIVIDVR